MASMSLPIPNLFFLALLFLSSNLAFGIKVTLSSTLTTNDKSPLWLSSSGEFAFGFHQLNNTNFFVLAIWYYKIPEKTIVWNANADKPAPIGSKVQLTANGLKLSCPQGEVIWTADPAEAISYGAMLDTGNFVLASTDSTYVCESFNHPTDTLLPTQNLERDGTLSSRLTENNYTRGRFELFFQDNSLSLRPIGWPSESRYKSYYDIDASRLLFNESGYIYVETANGSKVPLWNNPALDSKAYYYRATLDFYGVLTQYAYPRGSNIDPQGWTIVQYVPENICAPVFDDVGRGACGYNSYCIMENRRPICKCPDGYSLVDPTNQFDGCQPEISLGCGADDEESQQRPEEVYEFKVLQQVNWPTGDYERLENQTQQDCKTSCLYDCMCSVAIFNFNDLRCWKKKLPLSNGRIESPQSGTQALIRTRVRPLGPSDAEKKNPSDHAVMKEDRAKQIFSSPFIGSLVINSVLLATVILVVLFKNKKIVRAPGTLLETNLHSFTYEALKEATNGFTEEIGRGSFGIVYKGTLGSGSYNVVAVKKLDRLAQEPEKEFKTELGAIGKTCHKNLVKLIGFCDEGVYRLLVYEFMSNGTLADMLFGQSKPLWNLRVAIALGIARGLVYLHEECDTPIIHCDIKPQNILIDEYFRAKISDFGLAKLLMSDQSRTQTMIRGTRGYVAPEWCKNIPVTVKVDVYSFGVMLLEIICCRRSVLQMNQSEEEEKALLTDWAYDCYVEGRIDALVEDDREAMADIGRLQKWVMVAIWCIQEHHEMRPTMKMVMQMLEDLVDVPTPPAPFS